MKTLKMPKINMTTHLIIQIVYPLILSNSRRINCKTTRHICLRGSKQTLWFTMNLNKNNGIFLFPVQLLQPVVMVFLKFYGIIGRWSWFNLMVISPINSFKLYLTKFSLTYQMVISLKISMVTYLYMEVITTLYIHNNRVIFVWIYMIFPINVVTGIISILDTGPFKWSFTRPWFMCQ